MPRRAPTTAAAIGTNASSKRDGLAHERHLGTLDAIQGCLDRGFVREQIVLVGVVFLTAHVRPLLDELVVGEQAPLLDLGSNGWPAPPAMFVVSVGLVGSGKVAL